MHTISAKLALCLTLVPAVFAQFFGATGRFHPLYSGQANPFNDLLTIAAIGGLESNDLLLLNLLYGNGLRMGPAPVRPQAQVQRTLSLLGVLDGADIPDGQAGQGRGSRRRGGAKRQRGAGGARQAVEEPAGGARGRRGKRGKRRGGGGGAQ